MISPAYLAKLIEMHRARQAAQDATVTSLDDRRDRDRPVVRAA
jgi:DNA-directed RNA polymerase subunit K/omega